MPDGKILFNSSKKAGQVCSLLNQIIVAYIDKRINHFYVDGKRLVYHINDWDEEEKLRKIISKSKV